MSFLARVLSNISSRSYWSRRWRSPRPLRLLHPTPLLSSINRVTHCLRALASHCVCGPEAAKQPYRLHFSIFIVDIYFCNYLSTSPSAEDDMLKLTLLLPSFSLLLLAHKHADRRPDRQMWEDMTKRRNSYSVTGGFIQKWDNEWLNLTVRTPPPSHQHPCIAVSVGDDSLLNLCTCK